MSKKQIDTIRSESESKGKSESTERSRKRTSGSPSGKRKKPKVSEINGYEHVGSHRKKLGAESPTITEADPETEYYLKSTLNFLRGSCQTLDQSSKRLSRIEKKSKVITSIYKELSK